MAAVLVVTTGATLFQGANASRSGMIPRAITTQSLLASTESHLPFLSAFGRDAEESSDFLKTDVINCVDLPVRSGADLFPSTVDEVYNLISATFSGIQQSSHPRRRPGCMIISGTDSLEELAFALSLWLSPYIEKDGGPVVVLTGAMKPSDHLSFDGAGNVADSLRVLGSNDTPSGVYVLMNEAIHSARYVRKDDSQRIGAFQSHPGPIGYIRRGRPMWYYRPLESSHVAPGVSLTIPPIPKPQLRSILANIHNPFGRFNVPLVTISFPAPDPPNSSTPLPHGIVIACPGTGSLPTSWLEALSPAWTSRIPVVLVSRCATGGNYDDVAYKGSKEKYRRKGFLLDEYEGLNPIQARILMMFRLAIAETTWSDSKL
ncbi:Asparaginase/glutaminase [Cladochytrium replicatum]|nr:Asparaginase/glutaminase [Cladochytrium replicatum]